MTAVEEWEQRGQRLPIAGPDIFVIDGPGDESGDPVLILHGFPSCSFDWRRVIDHINRRVVLLDMLGYGLSAKPLDHRYSLFEQADIVEKVVATLDISSVVLVSHDVGDSVGGELLARELDGNLGFSVSARVLTNGSIYMDLVQLSAGQQLLLAMPDEVLPEDAALTEELFGPSLASTFGEKTQPDAEELAAQWELLAREGGNRILPRLIRYIEERKIHEPRWTGAIEGHHAPLTIVWGDADPIAVFPMAERLATKRPDATLVRLQGIGHYPMIEAPQETAAAIVSALAKGSRAR